METASNSWILFSIYRIFFLVTTFSKGLTSSHPKNTRADKGFSLWLSLSKDMYIFICPYWFGIITDPLSGSPNRHFKGILLQFYLWNHRYFYVGNSRTILPITRLADSTNIATFVGIVILLLGYQSHRQHIIWSMVLWFERISKYCASMLYWYFRPTLRVIFLCAYFPQLFQMAFRHIFHVELYRIVADRLQLLVVSGYTLPT